MNIRVFLFFLTLGTIFYWLGFLIIIFKIDPEQASGLSFMFFYLNFFLAILGTLFLAGNLLRVKFSQRQLVEKRIETSLRQAFFFTILILGLAVLQHYHLANWLNIILLILILAILELFFISRKKGKNFYGPTSYEGQDSTT